MLQILKQTREEERSMYDRLPKSILIEMLMNCNDIITTLAQTKNCITPEKDYEILSYKFQNNIYTKKFNGLYTDYQTYILENPEKAKIYSVKRLSDGEIFTIGDKFMDGEVNAMEVVNNEMWIFHNGIKPNIKLKEAKKIKTPLFTTEDGVDIFEGDKYFQLALTFKPNFREAIYEEIARSNIKYSYSFKEGREQLNKSGRYYFSTREKAEEYALMNKPCLSINDILLMQDGMLHLEKKLKELVKSKI